MIVIIQIIRKGSGRVRRIRAIFWLDRLISIFQVNSNLLYFATLIVAYLIYFNQFI